jgi:PPOX class probable F420-dependent enzyme
MKTEVQKLTKGSNLAVLSTLLPSGRVQAQPVWIDSDDDCILVNTEVGRTKAENVRRDPRVTVTVLDAEDPYHYAEIRGDVVEMVTGPEARSHIDDLSVRYTGKLYDPSAITTERVILRIAPRVERVAG